MSESLTFFWLLSYDVTSGCPWKMHFNQEHSIFTKTWSILFTKEKAEKCIMFYIISNVATHMKVMFFLIVLSWIKYHFHFTQILHLTSTISLVLIVFQDLKTKCILHRNNRAKEAVKRKLKNAGNRVLLLKIFIIHNWIFDI